MNKREALIKCRLQWDYIAKTGTDDKSIYFDSLSEQGIIEKVPSSECYCCEYDEQFPIELECSNCPLTEYAWGSEGCLRGSSVFRSWALCDDVESRKLYARMMVRACNLAIADLEEPYGQIY